MRKKLLPILLILEGCGSLNVKGGTSNEVHGEIKQSITIDIPFCNDLPADQKVACIQAFVDLFKTLSGDNCKVSAEGSLDNSEACQKVIEVLQKQQSP